MPFGDGSGPTGAGPMTGRGAGYCAGYPTPGYANPINRFGRGRGRGGGSRGGGRGLGNQFYANGILGLARYNYGYSYPSLKVRGITHGFPSKVI